MLVQVGFALLCFFFTGTLTSGRPPGLALAGFLAVSWGSRVLIQMFYYNREPRRANPLFDVLFLLGDGSPTVVLTLAALLTCVTEG
jgi:hypothetical protein